MIQVGKIEENDKDRMLRMMRRFYAMILAVSLLMLGCSFFGQQDESSSGDVAGTDEVMGDVSDPFILRDCGTAILCSGPEISVGDTDRKPFFRL